MPERFWLECPSCGATRSLGAHFFGCATCRDASGFPHWLEVRYDLARFDASFLERPGRVRDYAPLLPVRDPAAMRTLGEGNTPLVRLDALNRELGLPDLWLKCEHVQPTASFKDRLHTVSMTVARELGFARAAIVTTGNSGAACAAFGALNGVAVQAYVHPDAASEVRFLVGRYGAEVIDTPADVEERLERLVREAGVYPCTLMGTFAGPANPYGVEGYKTIAFEIVGQLGRAPDRVCVPTSGGDALYGPFKGFCELRALGRIDTLPRMTACQAEGADFVARTLREQRSAMAEVMPATLALSIGDPTGSECIRTAIASSGGDAWVASDDEIVAMAARLARLGVFVEYASAASVAALARAADEGRVDRGETVVATLTGSGLKWLSQIAKKGKQAIA